MNGGAKLTERGANLIIGKRVERMNDNERTKLILPPASLCF